MRGPAADAGAPRYLSAAQALAAPGQARLMITHGLSGSGKSFVSGALLAHCGAIRLRSDVERKRLFGLQPLERSAALGEDQVYSQEATRKTFDALRDRAHVALAAGYPTIVDAAFLKQDEREAMRRLAREMAVPFAILHCHAQEAMLRHRIAARLAGAGDASEADERVLQMQLGFAQALSAQEGPDVIDVDTAAALDLAAIDRRWKASAVPRD
jgi:predicted kinase